MKQEGVMGEADEAQGLRVFVIANQKGGVGKTTTAISLAAAAASAGHRVLLVDIDSQANATSGLGVQGVTSAPAGHYLVRPAEVGHFIRETYIDRLHVLGSTPELIQVEGSLSKMADGQRQLIRALERVGSNYDMAFIDCPPSLGLLTRNGLMAAEAIFIPIQCEYFAMEGLGRILEAVRQARAAGNPRLDIGGIVLTMFDPEEELSRDVEREVREYFEEKVFRTNICRDIAISESNSHGRSIFDYAPASPGAHDYLFLTQEVLHGIG